MFLVADLHTKRPNCTNTSSPSVLPDHERFAHQDRCNTAGPRISPRTENPRWNFAEVGLAVTVYCHSWFLALIRRLEKVRAAVDGHVLWHEFPRKSNWKHSGWFWISHENSWLFRNFAIRTNNSVKILMWCGAKCWVLWFMANIAKRRLISNSRSMEGQLKVGHQEPLCHSLISSSSYKS